MKWGTMVAAASVRALRQFIVKLHSRCNLRCDYCYVYESVDKRWRTQPTSMSRPTIDSAIRRIAEHVRRYEPADVDIVLHGGEPLLAGHRKIEYLLDSARRQIGVHCRIRCTLQTNGVLIDERYLDLFDEWDVRIGVSLDGDVTAHDRHRRAYDGAGTYKQVMAALEKLRERQLLAGLLCVVDLRNDPAATYETLLRFHPPMVDFLLPHGNWSTPPPRLATGGTPYADWLAAVFDRWYRAGERETRVRQFDEIINVLFGGPSLVEGVGRDPARMVVIQTDGGIEHSDVLSTAFEGAAATGLNVAEHSFDELRPLVLPVSDVCESCSLHRVCGGGLPAHRYRDGTGFANPSVYCADLYRLISHIRRTLAADLAVL
jgi:uncharacterized protein